MSTEGFESSGDITDLIANLASDVSWVDDLPIPTLDEIRDRVSKFSQQERAEAEREVLRVEFGNAAFAVAKGYLDLNDIDSAEQWLTVADEHHVPEAKEVKRLVESIVALRDCVQKDIGGEDDALDFGQLIGAGVANCLLAISENSQIEVDELLYSTLVEMAKILDRTRADAAGKTPTPGGSANPAKKVKYSSERERPAPIELLWLLHDWLVPVANLPSRKKELSTRHETALSNLVSSAIFQDSSIAEELDGCTFRVLLFHSQSLANTHLFSINLSTDTRPGGKWSNLLEVAVQRRKLTDYASWSKWNRRLLVALPNSSCEHSGAFSTTILTALFEHVIPGHGLTVEQVKRLAWEMVQGVMVGRPKNNLLPLPAIFLDSSASSPSRCDSTYAAIRLVVGEEQQFWSHELERFEKKVDVADGSKDTCQRVRFPEADRNIGNLDLHGWTKENPISVNQAIRKLKETGNNYVFFDDIDSRQPTVVYRRVDAKQGRVMRLTEPVKLTEPLKESGPAALQILSSSVLAQQPLHADSWTKEAEAPGDKNISEVDDDGEIGKIDEFLIIQCGSNPSQ